MIHDMSKSIGQWQWLNHGVVSRHSSGLQKEERFWRISERELEGSVTISAGGANGKFSTSGGVGGAVVLPLVCRQ